MAINGKKVHQAIFHRQQKNSNFVGKSPNTQLFICSLSKKGKDYMHDRNFFHKYEKVWQAGFQFPLFCKYFISLLNIKYLHLLAIVSFSCENFNIIDLLQAIIAQQLMMIDSLFHPKISPKLTISNHMELLKEIALFDSAMRYIKVKNV